MHQFFRLAVLIAVFGAGLLSPSSAAPSEERAIDDTIACRKIEDASERLACLDSAAAALAVTRNLREEEAAEKRQRDRTFFGLSQPKTNPDEKTLSITETPEEFGGESLPESRKKKEQTQLKQITAKITEYNVNRSGKVTVTLENGQVWRQLNSDGTKLILSAKGREYTARIKRGLVGNYLMKINEVGKTIRVQRIK